MNDAELTSLFNACISGDISPERHRALQAKLKSDPQARAVFREFMDIEASLRTWASEDALADAIKSDKLTRQQPEFSRSRLWRRRVSMAVTVAASLALLAFGGWYLGIQKDRNRQIAHPARNPQILPVAFFGTVRQTEDCVWKSPVTLASGSRFSNGTYSLTSGTAELKFTSGTNMLLEAPCELKVVSGDTAHLLAGNVFVNVTELSDGFILETPDATIIDEGTEYAVSLDDESTEVHVFEGSVIWEPVLGGEPAESEYIEAGEARRYERSRPGKGARIPLEMRKFVCSLAASERETAGVNLLMYDGFENLAGRLRRDRSGFGWSGGWESGFAGRGRIATIVESPIGDVFGMDRSGRRQLQLSDGEAIRRDFERPLLLETGNAYFVSLLIQRASGDAETGQFFQVSISGDEGYRGHRMRREVSFGITSEGLPFLKSGGTIIQSAPPIEDGLVYFCVARVIVSDAQSLETSLRLYRPGEVVDGSEPTAWTTVGLAQLRDSDLVRIRLAVGPEAVYEIDELKIGRTWQSVTALAIDPDIAGPE